MDQVVTSKLVLDRLMVDAQQFAKPEVRVATIDRLVAACDAVENGEAAKAVHNPSSMLRRRAINATNVDKYIRAMNWRGPTRTTIAKDIDGLQAYVKAREEERSKPKTKGKPLINSQIEARLAEIESLELRQFFRSEIEKRRIADQKLKLLVSGLLKIPGIDVQVLLEPGRDDRHKILPTPSNEFVSEMNRSKVLNFLKRLSDEDELRHLGLRKEGEDILSLTGADIILGDELQALHEISRSVGEQR
ncbi:hypothetical protein R3X27_12625 [Tropicimonas sp. TH_r6]|uniref:hypothetical protein n=1 Tax=Tropicimonas sp. TH_r6 TaxID=3082085 RepID=UPI002955B993|nr:hypothetical protein [Tropicimonas sp. TH_r6]MDV7143525.1 hypothetical protein [Tropicimonas sp. TH_r6]